VKSLECRDGPRAPTAIHGLLGPKFQLIDKAITIAGCLEKHFTPHKFCDENHSWRVEARVQALLEAEVNEPLQKVSNVTYRN
jgi:hypothetical protein